VSHAAKKQQDRTVLKTERSCTAKDDYNQLLHKMHEDEIIRLCLPTASGNWD